jgi:hypothetical protein
MTITVVFCRMGIFRNRPEKERGIPRDCYGSDGQQVQTFLDQRLCHGVPCLQSIFQKAFVGLPDFAISSQIFQPLTFIRQMS